MPTIHYNPEAPCVWVDNNLLIGNRRIDTDTREPALVVNYQAFPLSTICDMIAEWYKRAEERAAEAEAVRLAELAGRLDVDAERDITTAIQYYGLTHSRSRDMLRDLLRADRARLTHATATYDPTPIRNHPTRAPQVGDRVVVIGSDAPDNDPPIGRVGVVRGIYPLSLVCDFGGGWNHNMWQSELAYAAVVK